jgi:hypothetical protein
MLFQLYFEYSTIIADNHFHKATSHFENIILIILKSKTRRRKKVNNVLVPWELNKKNKIINNVISGIWRKVEVSYA